MNYESTLNLCWQWNSMKYKVFESAPKWNSTRLFTTKLCTKRNFITWGRHLGDVHVFNTSTKTSHFINDFDPLRLNLPVDIRFTTNTSRLQLTSHLLTLIISHTDKIPTSVCNDPHHLTAIKLKCFKQRKWKHELSPWKGVTNTNNIIWCVDTGYIVLGPKACGDGWLIIGLGGIPDVLESYL